jgi:hypothetical protein
VANLTLCGIGAYSGLLLAWLLGWSELVGCLAGWCLVSFLLTGVTLSVRASDLFSNFQQISNIIKTKNIGKSKKRREGTQILVRTTLTLCN